MKFSDFQRACQLIKDLEGIAIDQFQSAEDEDYTDEFAPKIRELKKLMQNRELNDE